MAIFLFFFLDQINLPKGETQYKDLGKPSNFKAKIFGIFLYLMTVNCYIYHFSDFREDLMDNLLTIQSPSQTLTSSYNMMYEYYYIYL